MARRAAKKEEIFVKVARTGSTVKEVCLNGDRTVEDALNAAGVEYSESSRIRINGETVDLEDEVSDGDIITVSGSIKGGAI
jgi:ribosome-interacting GTPase 1